MSKAIGIYNFSKDALGVLKKCRVSGDVFIYILAIIFGALLNYAYAPMQQLWLLFASYSFLYFVTVRAGSFKRALVTGCIFNFSYLLLNNIWMTYFLSVDDTFLWSIPFALICLPMYLAIFPTICVVLLYYNRHQKSVVRAALFAATWVFFEYIRGVCSYGFSLSITGYAMAFSDNIAQSASVIGIHGLSVVTVFLSVIPAEIILSGNKKRGILWLGSLCVIICVMHIGGAYRLLSVPVAYDYSVKLRIVQGGLSPYQLWKMEYMQNAMVRKYLSLSLQSGYEDITHFIWGESTLPLLVDAQNSDLSALVNRLPQNSFLFTGSARSEMQKIFNSWIAVDNSTGRIKAYYDKSRLVPFGEFLPFRSLLLRLFKRGGLNGVHDYAFGSADMNIISIDNTPDFHVVICYETMFAGRLLRALNKSIEENRRLQWVVNITNDGWFGQSYGPYQHLAVSKIRSIESGLPFIRSTNTGISVVYDGYGRVMSSIPLNKEGIMDVYLPKGATSTVIRTLYRYTDPWLPYVLFLILCVLQPLANEIIPRIRRWNKSA